MKTGGQFGVKQGGQFPLKHGGQFKMKRGGQLVWNFQLYRYVKILYWSFGRKYKWAGFSGYDL